MDGNAERKNFRPELPAGLRQAGEGGLGNVLILPGGGYEHISVREGQPVADSFAAAGYRPWILSYTVRREGSAPLGTLPLREAAEAVRAVRERFPEEPVYVCGFSAGAHAAASLGVHWKDLEEDPGAWGGQEADICAAPEKKLAESWIAWKKGERPAGAGQAARRFRPDGLILCYPVITAGAYAHEGSMENLAGSDTALRAYFSLEQFVDADTPPAFLWHTAADGTVPVQNSLLFAAALAEKKVPFELHIYPNGVHGLSLAKKEVEDPAKGRVPDAHVAEWFADCICWLGLVPS